MLRVYQQRGLEAVLEALQAGQKPVLCLPTGSGKSWVCAALAASMTGRVLILTHRQELLTQNAEILSRYDPTAEHGIYSAGLNRRDTNSKILFAGIQSVYGRLDELQAAGPFEAVVIDEVHRVPHKTSDGIMYRAVLDSLPVAKLTGMSATPFRLDGGMLHQGEGAWFDTLIEPATVKDLVQQGYLAPLVGIGTSHRIDTTGVHIRQGDYVVSELSQVASDDLLITRTITECLKDAAGRKAGIIFAVDVTHAQLITAELHRQGETAAMITATTPKQERQDLIAAYKAGQFRWLVNVNIASEGFDYPGVDCIISLRPTLSKGLYTQQLGRGMRIAEGKQNCLILDCAGNSARHGGLGLLPEYKQRKTPAEKAKEEAEKRLAEAIAKRQEEVETRRRIWKHADRSAIVDPMTGTAEVQVHDIEYFTAPAKSRPGLTNLVVVYHAGQYRAKTWVCLEYSGGARWHAERWFYRRGLRAPSTAEEALDLLNEGRHQDPVSVTLKFEPWQVPGATGPNAIKMIPKIVIEHFAEAEADEAA